MKVGNEVDMTRRQVAARPTFAMALSAVALAIAGVLGLAAAGPAHAEVWVDLTQVCKEQYKQPTAEVDQLSDHNDPYSFYCYVEQETRSLGVPSGIEASVTKVTLGDLDVQAYCNKHYQGLPAKGWTGSSGPYWTCGDGSENF